MVAVENQESNEPLLLSNMSLSLCKNTEFIQQGFYANSYRQQQ